MKLKILHKRVLIFRLTEDYMFCKQKEYKSCVLKISPLSVSSVAQSCLTLWPHGLQHARLPSIPNSPSLLKLMPIKPGMPSSRPLLSPSLPALNLSQHQGLVPVTQPCPHHGSHSRESWVPAKEAETVTLGVLPKPQAHACLMMV